MAETDSVQPGGLFLQRVGTVIAAVIVRGGDDIDIRIDKHLQHFRAGAVVIGAALALVDALLTLAGHHAFQVDNAEVGLRQRGYTQHIA